MEKSCPLSIPFPLYGSLIYIYLCNQCLSPLTLRIRIPLDTTLCDKVCQWLVTGLWFSPSTPVSSTIKTDSHDITVILLKVTLNTLTLTLSNASYISSGSKMSFHRLSHSSIISVYFYIFLNIFSSRIYMIYLLQDILLKNHKIMLSYLVIKLYSAKAHACLS